MQRRLLDNLVIMTDKTGVYYRAAATITSVVWEEGGTVSKYDWFILSNWQK